MRRISLLLFLMFVGQCALAQSYGRLDFTLQNAQGQAIAGATINVYSETACGVPQNGTQAQLYSSATGGAISQPLYTDGFGSAYAYAAPGCVTVVYYSNYTGTRTFIDQNVIAGSTISIPVSVTNGGTGATTAAGALVNLGGISSTATGTQSMAGSLAVAGSVSAGINNFLSNLPILAPTTPGTTVDAVLNTYASYGAGTAVQNATGVSSWVYCNVVSVGINGPNCVSVYGNAVAGVSGSGVFGANFSALAPSGLTDVTLYGLEVDTVPGDASDIVNGIYSVTAGTYVANSSAFVTGANSTEWGNGLFIGPGTVSNYAIVIGTPLPFGSSAQSSLPVMFFNVDSSGTHHNATLTLDPTGTMDYYAFQSTGGLSLTGPGNNFSAGAVVLSGDLVTSSTDPNSLSTYGGIRLINSTPATSSTCSIPAAIQAYGTYWHGGSSTSYSIYQATTCTPGTDGAITYTIASNAATAPFTVAINGNENVTGNVTALGSLITPGYVVANTGLRAVFATPAISGTNYPSGTFSAFASVWNGSAAVNDSYTMQDVPGVGTNPNTVFSLVGAGSSGTHTFDTSTLSQVLLPATTLINNTAVCLSNGTNCPSISTVANITGAANSGWYNSGAATTSAIALGNNGLIGTNGSGVPSVITTLPSGVLGVTQTWTIDQQFTTIHATTILPPGISSNYGYFTLPTASTSATILRNENDVYSALNVSQSNSSSAAAALLITQSGTGPGIKTTNMVTTAAAPTVAASQIGYGSTVTASTSCGSLTLAAGCVVINVAGTTHYIPYY